MPQMLPVRWRSTSLRAVDQHQIAAQGVHPVLPQQPQCLFALESAGGIRAAGQSPHPAYAAGNERLSCVFCIMGSENDIKNGAKHHPELAARYIEIEDRTGYTMHMSRRSLREIVAA